MNYVKPLPPSFGVRFLRLRTHLDKVRIGFLGIKSKRLFQVKPLYQASTEPLTWLDAIKVANETGGRVIHIPTGECLRIYRVLEKF
jgi:hypothetical protein